ncbi:transcription factor IIA, alpha/beta subunit [Hypomontagnella monticulosa]|nr:transcription factor IIA, alpha/beta subunit [Hypomontagnella monticulosa]
MSNSQVGVVYQQIITDVMEASRVDFEEAGVDESVLEELKKGWQKKLSQQQLAVFPWDPKETAPPPAAAPPQPTPAPEPIPQVATNGAAYNQQHAQQAHGLTMPGSQPSGDPVIKHEPGVKTEPGLENNPMLTQSTQGNARMVQERVSQQLQSMYGDRAAASISKLQADAMNGAQPNQQRPGNQTPQQNYAGPYQGHPQQQQYRPTMPSNGQQQRAPMPNGQRPAPSQTDGADDAEGHFGVLMRRTPGGEPVEMGRVEIDNLIHAQIAANAKAMEGGGLMLPLKRTGKGKAISHHRASTTGGPSQFDGPDDDVKDEDDDEDAINSDLDDPDDNIEEDDDDEDGAQIMLCMYDKVQRVKNKWKCVLKDGVLSVNGKDYVFHKATGEYEW